MKKRLITVLTLFVCYCAHADTILTVEYLDGSQAKEQLSKLSKIVFGGSGQISFNYESGGTADYGAVANTDKFVFVEGELSSAASLPANPLVRVFPNPATESVSVTGLEDGQTVSVYTAAGQLVLRTSDAEFNVAGFTAGQYFIVVGKSVVKLIKK
ncbi:MAG: T9SS type A sorting domain-containing protein [Paludibacteraceae bacterium]|nr:T9SS type A sorting domain-containing protein [Paludibacteraceae bacterium]